MRTATRLRAISGARSPQASGKPIDRIMPTFVNQPGVPLVDVKAACANGRPAADAHAAAVRARSFGAAGGGALADSALRQPPDRKTPTCQIVSEATQTITLAGASCPPWVFVNAGAHGYYRTAYPPDMLRAMAAHLETDLSAPERLSLMDDEWALVRAGTAHVADYLTLASGFSGEGTSGVLGALTGRLDFVHDYLTTDRDEAAIRSLRPPAAPADRRTRRLRAGRNRSGRSARAARGGHRLARHHWRRPRRRRAGARRARSRAGGRRAARSHHGRIDRQRRRQPWRRAPVRRAARGRGCRNGAGRSLSLSCSR